MTTNTKPDARALFLELAENRMAEAARLTRDAGRFLELADAAPTLGADE